MPTYSVYLNQQYGVAESYASLSGTSMAAPHVSAVIALIKYKDSSKTIDGIKTAMYGTAANLNASSEKQGNGRVDAYKAVNYVQTTSCTPGKKRTC